MKNNYFTIGQISRIKGITIKALRFYERLGVIKPAYTDPETKYRYYAIEQFIQFDVIRALRSLDISPKDIRDILGEKDTGRLLEYLEKQEDNARQKIRGLQKTIKTIGLTRGTIVEAQARITREDVYTREIPKRYCLTQKIKDPFEEREVLVQFSEFPMMIEKKGLLDTYITGVALLPEATHQFHPAYIFNLVARYKDADRKELSTIPAGKYACVCYNRENISCQQQRFFRYLENNKLTPRLILQVDLLNDVFNSDNYYFELQALI